MDLDAAEFALCADDFERHKFPGVQCVIGRAKLSAVIRVHQPGPMCKIYIWRWSRSGASLEFIDPAAEDMRLLMAAATTPPAFFDALLHICSELSATAQSIGHRYTQDEP